MPNHVLQLDCTHNSNVLEMEFDIAPYGGELTDLWVEFDVAFNAAWITRVLANPSDEGELLDLSPFGGSTFALSVNNSAGVLKWETLLGGVSFPANTPYAPTPAITSLQFYRAKVHYTTATPPTVEAWIDSVSVGAINNIGATGGSGITFLDLQAIGMAVAGPLVYMDNFTLGSSEGSSDIASDNFEGGSLSPSTWNSFISTDASIIVDPGIAPPPSTAPTADFSGTPTTGNAPLSVAFTDLSSPGPSGPIIAWSWDFGDGDVSTDQNPTHIYLLEGNYTVSLTITGTLPDGSDTKTSVNYISISPPIVPPGISIAPTNSVFDDPPLWTRLDTIDGVSIQNVNIVRGRPDERSKTSPASITVRGVDSEGALDPTNPNSPLAGHLDPVKQVAITMYNPYEGTWNWRFRGYLSDITLSFDTDLSETIMDFELVFTDMLDLLNDSEVIPDGAGNLAPTENVGDCFYTGQHCDDRQFAVLADAATAFYQEIWPVSMLQIASGNVFVQGRAYSNQTSLLQVIDEACDAESPYATNRFITCDGQYAFRGRYYRYVPDFVIAFDGVRKPGHRMLQWNVVDVPSYSVGSSQAIAQNITFTRGKTNLINAALITPANIRQDLIPFQAVHDSTSIGKYGPRTSGMSLENLITSDPEDKNDNAMQECKSYAQAIVDNYKNPVTRVSQLKFSNPYNDHNDEGMNLWNIMCNIELSDLIHIYTHHPGGGGFNGDRHYVEQITYDIQPLKGDIWQVQMTLDLTPFAYYATMPDSWNPPGGRGEPVLEAEFGYAQ